MIDHPFSEGYIEILFNDFETYVLWKKWLLRQSSDFETCAIII